MSLPRVVTRDGSQRSHGGGNRRRPDTTRRRLPGPRAIAGAIGRGLRQALPLLVVFAIVGGVSGAAWAGYRFLTTSSRFAVTAVVIRGNHALDEAAVRARLGVADGDNIFGVRPARLEAALAADPWVASVEVHRELPHTLVVEIVERVAAALVELDGFYLTDAAGHPFKRADVAGRDGDGAALPIVTGVARAELIADAAETERRIAQAIAVARAWAAPGDGDGAGATRPRLGEVHVDGRRGLTVFGYAPAIAIHLGPIDADGDELPARLSRFDQAWAALDERERAAVHTLHLDNTARPDHVTVGMSALRTGD